MLWRVTLNPNSHINWMQNQAFLFKHGYRPEGRASAAANLVWIIQASALSTAAIACSLAVGNNGTEVSPA